jgi:hypothetical protein
MVKLIFEEGKPVHFQIIPYKQCHRALEVTPLENSESDQFLQRIEERSGIISKPIELETYWYNFSKKRLVSYLSKTYGYGRIRRKLVRLGILNSKVAKDSRFLQLLNCLRSDVHREAFVHALKNNY